jgi:hypothetical protein
MSSHKLVEIGVNNITSNDYLEAMNAAIQKSRTINPMPFFSGAQKFIEDTLQSLKTDQSFVFTGYTK